MKKLLTILALSFGAFAYAEEYTEYRLVDRVQMETNRAIYFASNQGWGVKGCPNAKYIYIKAGDDRLANQILSLVLSSQATGRKIKARGECTDDKARFRIKYIFQGEK